MDRAVAPAASLPQNLKLDMESIFAFKGYYVAAYTRTVSPGQFIGRATICVDRPTRAEWATGEERVTTVGTYADEAKALHAAEFQARQLIDGLQPNWDPFTGPGSLPPLRRP